MNVQEITSLEKKGSFCVSSKQQTSGQAEQRRSPGHRHFLASYSASSVRSCQAADGVCVYTKVKS